MPREDYQQQLEGLRADVLDMSTLVLDRLRMAVTALENGDQELARTVIDGDEEINELYLELEGDCVDLLALQQPVAGDLRRIAASFKILTDLERIGDLATNLAGYAPVAQRDYHSEVDVEAIGETTIEMVEDAMTAYAEDDAGACYDIADRDDEVDAQCRRAGETVVRGLVVSERAAADAFDPLFEDVSRLLLTLRDLERVGDHAVNVAARTLYMVESDDELIY